MSAPTSIPPESFGSLAAAAWPLAQAAKALHALARHAGLPMLPVDETTAPGSLSLENVDAWIEQAAARRDLQADQVFLALQELDAFLSRGAPALLRLTALEGTSLLALVGSHGRFVHALAPDLRVHRIAAREVRSAIRRPFEAGVETEIDAVLGRIGFGERARARARAALLTERLKPARFRGCWMLRLPPGARAGHAAREVRLPRRLVTVAAAHLTQYALFVTSWWLLGRGVLNGTIDRGWLVGWLLLAASSIPLRLLSTWNQSLAAVSIGAWLRRRLLRGAVMTNRQDIKQRGSGEFFGLAIEAAAIDSLALTGTTFAVFAVIELAIAAAILAAGAGAFAAALPLLWFGLAVSLASAYISRRRKWTDARLRMTGRLLESMIGHRTRMIQQSPEKRHENDDEALDEYLDRGVRMDQASVLMAALVPRGWLVFACCMLTPMFVGGAMSSRIAIAIGGVLLAYRAFQRLSGGVFGLAGATIAAAVLGPLLRAAARREPPALSVSMAAAPRDVVTSAESVAVVRDLTFRYSANAEPVLQGCSVTIPRHARLLLEGPSGAGKTTFASLLAGLETADAGVVLMGGLDRAAIGAAGWRQRVMVAPQAHDNYIVSGSLAFNLLMGRGWPAERADLIEADAICRELGLGELLDRLPAGLHQMVGETGWQLSQGERVRVFLARALLHKPDLLLLDESFGTLDPDNVERATRCVDKRAHATLMVAHF